MRVITRCCVLFLWMHTLTFVKSQDCTREAFLNGPLFDPNFDTTNLDARYPGGKQVRVGCNVGYSGFFKLICSEGKWMSKGNKCQPISCGHPGDAQFADFHLEKGDDFVFGSKVVYTCHKGYQMVSRINYRYCLAQGWDGVVPVCEAKQCPQIHVDDNVQVYGDQEESTYGNVVQFSCRSSNQILSGLSEIYCDEYGDWSGPPPTCKEIKCTVPRIENGYVPGDIKEFREHEILQFECNAKYVRTEGRPSKCIKIGSGAEWSPTPICELIKCKVTLPPLEGTRYEPEYRNVFLPGDTLRVICGRKYWIFTLQDTSVETTCRDNGEWTVRPVCQEVTCSNQRDRLVQSWNVYWGQRTTLDTTVRYRCRSGYKSTDGTDVATCTRDGWRPNPFCEEITCDREEVKNAVNLNPNKQIYKYNEQAEYRCKDGYEGRPIRTCGAQGWTGNSQCTEKPCDKLQIEDATIVGMQKTRYQHNDEVHYTCNNDKTPFTATCRLGDWNVTHDCKGCPKAVVPNGFVVSFKGRVYYSCNENYKLFNKGWWGEAKCTDKLWTGLGRCIDKRHCGKIPVIPNGRVSDRAQSFHRHGQSIQIVCKDGYRAHLEQLTCHEGKWNSNELQLQNICTPSDDSCNPPPRVANAVVLTPYQKKYAPDSEVIYRCRDTYATEGGDALRCKNGDWDNSIKCIQYCGQFKEERQAMTFISNKDRYRPGEKIHYQCTTTDNYGTATCVNGQWNKSVECEEYCDKFKEKRQAMTFISNKDRYNPGERIHYQCTTKNDNGIATCIDGQWNKSVECEALRSNCDLPPRNGEITVKGLPENDIPILTDHIITFSCDSPGKHLSGSAVLICGDDGWNHPFPSCEDMTCKVDKMDPHITVSVTPSTEPIQTGHKLKFRCDSRYTLEGSVETECLETGQWSAPFPTCSEKCEVTGVPDSVRINSQVQNNLLGKGESLKFVCHRYDYFVQGAAEVECLGNGQWSQPFPTCGPALGCRRHPPPLEDGDTKESGRIPYSHNERVEYVCQPFYTMEGDPFKTCINGEWTGQMRCLRPCTVDKEAMSQRHIAFRYSRDDKLYSAHDDEIEFRCTPNWRRPVSGVAMRQKCLNGVMTLPSCQ